VGRITRQGGTAEQIKEHQDSILSNATKTSKDRVKLSYILDRIASEEGLHVTDADVEGRIQALATRYAVTPERLREELGKDDGAGMEDLRRTLRAGRTLDFIVEQARAKA
jgi:FKBP-type peptidyl-prolyl cis-trans isomerase (trigger factor)